MSDRDMLDEMFEESDLRHGRRLNAEEYAQQFALHGLEARVNLLKRLDKDTPLNLSQASERHDYVSKMKRVHFRLSALGK